MWIDNRRIGILLCKENRCCYGLVKKDIGFVILQKHCKCADESESSLCCIKGWKPVYCNSRHLDEKKMSYRPIEASPLAVNWVLRKGRLFLLGNDQLDVVVHHKPLLKIFGDKPLHEIENPILQKFKEEIMLFSFIYSHR